MPKVAPSVLHIKSSTSDVPTEKIYCNTSIETLINKPRSAVIKTRFRIAIPSDNVDENVMPNGMKNITFINIERYNSGLSFAINSNRKGIKCNA